MAGDRHVVGLGFGDARSYGADTDFRHQLDADRRLRIRVLQIVNQLREVFDRIDVVMRGRRDQADARHRVPQIADVFGHFVTRQLAAFAGLGTLRHLDLNLVGAREIFGSDAEAARRDLLDPRA